MKKLMAVLFISGAGLSLAAVSASAQGMGGKETTIKGEVVDTACFLMGEKRGAAHKECAIACAKAGQDLGIYDESTKTLYFLAGEKPGTDPNAQVKDHIAETIEVKGMVFERAGAKGIVIKSVTPVR